MSNHTKLTIIKAEDAEYTEVVFEQGYTSDVFHLLASGLAAAAMQFAKKGKEAEAVAVTSMKALQLISEGKSERIDESVLMKKEKLS